MKGWYGIPAKREQTLTEQRSGMCSAQCVANRQALTLELMDLMASPPNK
jgi:hypothetical protein